MRADGLFYFKDLAHVIVIELAVLKSMGQVSKLDFYVTVLRQNSSFNKLQSLLIRPSVD